MCDVPVAVMHSLRLISIKVLKIPSRYRKVNLNTSNDYKRNTLTAS